MSRRIYFDPFGQITPLEIQKYLKTKKEFESGKAVIQPNTDTVQHPNTHMWSLMFICTTIFDA